jgi:hypothetical protein
MNKEDYQRDLEERQRIHLENVARLNNTNYFNQPIWKPCLHDQCITCHGTGIDAFGKACFHSLYCDCPKCSTTC